MILWFSNFPPIESKKGDTEFDRHIGLESVRMDNSFKKLGNEIFDRNTAKTLIKSYFEV